MDPSLGLGLGHSLHPVNSAFEFEFTVNHIAADQGDNLLKSADTDGTAAHDLDLPSLKLGKPGVHPE